jgi:hypothetical protein
MYGWLLFRAESFAQIVSFTRALANPSNLFTPFVGKGLVQQAFYLAPMISLETWMAKKGMGELIFDAPWLNAGFHLALVYAAILIGAQGSDAFLYFNF